MDKSAKRGFSLFLAILMLSVMCIIPAQALSPYDKDRDLNHVYPPPSCSAKIPDLKEHEEVYGYWTEGRYFICTALDKNMLLDLAGGGTDNGNNVQIYGYNWSDAQDFTIQHVKGEWYVIKHTTSGKVLDIAGVSSESGTNVFLWEYHGGDNQLWRFISNGGSYYRIQSKLGTYLDVCGGETTDGTNVWAYEGNGSNAQLWGLTSVYTDEIRLSSYNVTVWKGKSKTITASYHFDNDKERSLYRYVPVYYENGNYATLEYVNLNVRNEWCYTAGTADLVITGKNQTWWAGRYANGNWNQHYAIYYATFLEPNNDPGSPGNIMDKKALNITVY